MSRAGCDAQQTHRQPLPPVPIKGHLYPNPPSRRFYRDRTADDNSVAGLKADSVSLASVGTGRRIAALFTGQSDIETALVPTCLDYFSSSLLGCRRLWSRVFRSQI